MARTPSPWFWDERQGWYVNKGGQRHFLGEHPQGAPPPRKSKGKWNAPPAIVQAFHALMAAPAEPKAAGKTAVKADGLTVAAILDKFLDWCQKQRAGRTYDWYRDHLQGFLNHLGASAGMEYADLKPFHVVEWADSHDDWSPASRRGAIVAVQRPFNWAEELGYIPASPVKKIKKPQPQRRDNPMTPEDFHTLLSRIKKGDPFRDLILFAWHTGCRPQEARHIEPRHVHLKDKRIVIPPEEAKGKQRPRVIILHGLALKIVRRLLRGRTEGKLFLNTKGRPWKKFAVCNRFDRLMLSYGIEKLKQEGIMMEPLPRFNRRAFTDKAQLLAARKVHQQQLRDKRKQMLKLARQYSKNFAAYDIRHGFCQRMLEGGVNHLAVAELMGHANGKMVAEVYSHMNKATEHLQAALKKGSGDA
jgi:integrase